jgi:hypothetical protein
MRRQTQVTTSAPHFLQNDTVVRLSDGSYWTVVRHTPLSAELLAVPWYKGLWWSFREWLWRWIE